MMEKIDASTERFRSGLHLAMKNWQRATTLTERFAALKALHAVPTFPMTEEISERLHLWRTQYVFREFLPFTERLAMDDMTEEDLLTLLSLSDESLNLALSAPPAWLEELALAFGVRSDVQVELLRTTDSPAAFVLLKPVEPLLRRAVIRLRRGLEELASHFSPCPFDIVSTVPLFLPYLKTQCMYALARTLTLELNIARIQQRLVGETPEERFGSFVDLLCQGQIDAVLAEYPVLARRLVTLVDHWVHYGLEFLEHLCMDWSELCLTFSPEGDPGPLVKVHMGAGDVHREGRSVLLLRFRSGLQLVYKPKSLAIDAHFQAMLIWLNSFECCPFLAPIKILDKGSYGWSEYIVARDCTSERDVRTFYERQGAYLALLYALEATDFHAENILAMGENPMLIDLEALFHPDTLSTANENPASRALRHSVLRVGMLPHRVYLSSESAGIDDSGMGGYAHQFTPYPVPVWEDVGTDMMRLTRQRRAMEMHQNLPRLSGQEVNLLAYKDAILTGFTAMYRLLMAQKERFLVEHLPRFRQDEVRVILRATRFYQQLLQGSFHPNNLRDGLDCDRYLDRLFFGYGQWLQDSRVITAERVALSGGDIPMFTTYTDSRDLCTSSGEHIPNFFPQSGFQAVQARIQQLSEQDLRQQIWFIEASFASLYPRTERIGGSAQYLPSSFTPAPVTRERLLTAASRIGRKLSLMALRDETGAGWLTVAAANRHTWSIEVAGIDLYDGTSGIILFLAYLGQLTGDEHFTSLAQTALRTLRATLNEWMQTRQPVGIGAFQGLSSVIYLFCHLGTLWQQSELLDECEHLIALLLPLIEQDANFDIIGGAAGCLLALLAVYHSNASPSALSAAIQCGEHLLKHACQMDVGVGWKTAQQEIPLTGFSHGVAGIAYSLLRLSAVSAAPRFKHMALEALAYERSLFSVETQNWPDLRISQAESMDRDDEIDRKSAEHWMVTWCHGAPGIGLARLASLPYIDDARMYQEIDLACETTLAYGWGHNHSLCHGDSGNLETLLVAAHMSGSSQRYTQVEQLCALLLNDIEHNGYRTDVPSGIETPEFMTGLAGIGYELLRFVDVERVPSVLLLAPPCRQA